MGFNEAVIALKQITDEHAWYKAMEEVRNTFQEKEFFKEFPELEEGQAIFESDQLKLLKLTEPLNFSKDGQGFDRWWNSFFHLAGWVAKVKLV